MAVLQGLEELERKLDALELTLQRKLLLQAAKAGAELVREEAARNVAFGTGRSSREQIISAVASESNAKEAVVRVGPSKDAFYDLFLEIGTAHQAPQPYLEPAYDARKDEALDVMAAMFIDAVNDFNG